MPDNLDYRRQISKIAPKYQKRFQKNLFISPPCGLRAGNQTARCTQIEKTLKTLCFQGLSDGLGERIRTSGLLNPIQARYQTAPHPDIQFVLPSRNTKNYTTQGCFCQGEKSLWRRFCCKDFPSLRGTGFCGEESRPGGAVPSGARRICVPFSDQLPTIMFRISTSVDFMPSRPMRPMFWMVSSMSPLARPSPSWKHLSSLAMR